MFDTVSLQEIICLLLAEGANGDTVRLVQALHDKSSYVLKAQGDTTSVETTAGAKQGCNKLAPTLFKFLTGTLFRSLINKFGVEQVVNFLTGYADDLTLHRTIRSERELRAVHQLIAALLEEVKAHQLVVNLSKCVLVAKLAGRRPHSCWIINAKGERVKGWRVGPNKSFPALQGGPSCKYLGVIVSYGHFELQTLQFRIGEAKQKLHLVRQFVYNRRVASTKARLKVWKFSACFSQACLTPGCVQILPKLSGAGTRSRYALS